MAWVLIMEDDTQVRVLAEEILKEAGHHTLSAANVAEALALLRAYELINVLFADINLEEGGPNGLELAQAAVKILPKLKVLYTTGADVTDGTRALFVEDSAFLPKPYTQRSLQQPSVPCFRISTPLHNGSRAAGRRNAWPRAEAAPHPPLYGAILESDLAPGGASLARDFDRWAEAPRAPSQNRRALTLAPRLLASSHGFRIGELNHPPHKITRPAGESDVRRRERLQPVALSPLSDGSLPVGRTISRRRCPEGGHHGRWTGAASSSLVMISIWPGLRGDPASNRIGSSHPLPTRAGSAPENAPRGSCARGALHFQDINAR
jgi:CheY-like chemotaxis protein